MQEFWCRSSSSRVPTLKPAVALPPPSPLQPIITRWGDVFLCKGGRGLVQSVYDDNFYMLWEK